MNLLTLQGANILFAFEISTNSRLYYETLFVFANRIVYVANPQ